jgi:hypothetical protein
MMSLGERLDAARITMRVSTGKRERDADGWYHDAYRVTLIHKGQTMRVPFRMGTGHNGSPPSLADVVDALVLDASTVRDADGFEEWARDLGYDPDSRKAEQTYRACVRQTDALTRLLGEDLLTAFLYDTERL